MEELEGRSPTYTAEVQVVVGSKTLVYTVEREFTGEKTFEECLRNIVRCHLAAGE